MIQALKAQLEWQYRLEPSKALRLVQALSAVEDGLAELARHGHPLHVEPGAPPIEADWPRTFYHHELGPKLVADAVQLREMGVGWHETPSAAQQAHGEALQFAGRAGIRIGRRLAPVNGETAHFVQAGPTKAELKAAFLQQRQRQRQKEKMNGLE